MLGVSPLFDCIDHKILLIISICLIIISLFVIEDSISFELEALLVSAILIFIVLFSIGLELLP